MDGIELYNEWCRRMNESSKSLFAIPNSTVSKEFKEGFAEGVRTSMDTLKDLIISQS